MPEPEPTPTPRRRRKIRKMTIVVWVWCILIVVWAVVGGISASNTSDCKHQQFHRACVEGSQAGAGIGVAVVLLIGFFGFVFLAIIWFMTRPKGRD